jgi:hypothetical protein
LFNLKFIKKMKTKKMSSLLVAISITILRITAQQVATTDVLALLNEMPKATTNVADAYQRSYQTTDTTRPNAKAFYKVWYDKFDAAAQQLEALSKDFYMKNPMGVASMSQPTVSRVSASQQSSINAATSELMQKMLTDPAFAKKFQKMSEQEQRAYMADMLANKGLSPVQGAPNMPSAAQPGMDVPWAELCSQFNQTLQDRTFIDEQMEMHTRYEAWHNEVVVWVEKEMKKVPMIQMGEAGRMPDPEKVKAIEQKARMAHREIADVTMKDMALFFNKVRDTTAQRLAALNTELKKVNYGQNYNFGIQYSLVLQTQGMMIHSLESLLKNEISVIEDCAKWEYAVRRNP